MYKVHHTKHISLAVSYSFEARSCPLSRTRHHVIVFKPSYGASAIISTMRSFSYFLCQLDDGVSCATIKLHLLMTGFLTVDETP